MKSHTEKNKKPIMALIYLMALLSLCFSNTLFAQGVKDIEEKEEINKELKSDESAPEATLLPLHQLFYKNQMGVRVNPLGLEDRFNIGYRLRLYDNPGLLWRDAHIGLDLGVTISPAIGRVGATLTIKPIAVMKLTATSNFVTYFGNLDYMQSFDSASAEHSEDIINKGSDAEENYSSMGFEGKLRAELLVKVGPVVLRTDTNFIYTDMDLTAGDPVYYHIGQDIMLPDAGWFLTNDTDLVFLTDFGLIAGLRASTVHSFYDESHFLPGESTENLNTPTFRAGPLVAYTFDNEPGGFKKPTAVLMVNWWFKHRYRTGVEVSQALPYMLLGFIFEGDIWNRD